MHYPQFHVHLSSMANAVLLTLLSILALVSIAFIGIQAVRYQQNATMPDRLFPDLRGQY